MVQQHQPRKPRGTPRGGQFAQKTRTETTQTLTPQNHPTQPHPNWLEPTISPRDLEWVQTGLDVLEYHQQTGHYPPQNAPGYAGKLGTWITRQRQQANGGANHHQLTPTRLHFLNHTLPQDWQNPGTTKTGQQDHTQFATRINQVSDFISQNGHYPQLCVGDENQNVLAVWLHTHLAKQQAGKLPDWQNQLIQNLPHN